MSNRRLGTRVLDWWLDDHPGTPATALAELLHVDKSALSHIASGKNAVGPALLAAIFVHLPEYTARPGAFYAMDRNGAGANDSATTAEGATQCLDDQAGPS